MQETTVKKSVVGPGIRVLTEKLSSVRSVSIGIWIDSGARDEAEGERGLTHFIEHLLFKGTLTLGAFEIAASFENIGADINASTGKEYTNLYARVIDKRLPEAFALMMDMIQHPAFDPRELDSERKVILEEILMHHDSPDELVHDYLSKAMWGEHPLGNSVLGDKSLIERVDRDRIVFFKGSSYVGSRMVVTAVGSVEHEDILKMVEENLDDLIAGKPAPRDDLLERPSEEKIVVERETEQAHICIGSKGLPKNHEDRFALGIMDNIIGGSMSSRLFQNVREKNGLAYSIYSFASMFVGTGMVGIYCGTHPLFVQRVVEIIETELAKVGRDGFSEEEIARAKNHLCGTLYISMEDSSNRMSRIARTELSGAEHLSIDEIAGKIMAVTEDDLRRVFDNTWGSGTACMAVIGPVERDRVGLSGILR